MSATIALLERLKAAHGGASDYRAAQMLGVKANTVYTWRSRGSQMEDATALKAASLLDLPPIDVIASIHAEQAKTDEERHFWNTLKSTTKTAH